MLFSGATSLLPQICNFPPTSCSHQSWVNSDPSPPVASRCCWKIVVVDLPELTSVRYPLLCQFFSSVGIQNLPCLSIFHPLWRWFCFLLYQGNQPWLVFHYLPSLTLYGIYSYNCLNHCFLSHWSFLQMWHLLVSEDNLFPCVRSFCPHHFSLFSFT